MVQLLEKVGRFCLRMNNNGEACTPQKSYFHLANLLTGHNNGVTIDGQLHVTWLQKSYLLVCLEWHLDVINKGQPCLCRGTGSTQEHTRQDLCKRLHWYNTLHAFNTRCGDGFTGKATWLETKATKWQRERERIFISAKNKNLQLN